MKCGPTQNKNKFWVPSSSMRPFVTQFYLYVMTVCSRNVSFLWMTTAFYWSSLRDDYCGSRSLASYLPRRHILSICHWDPHRCWVYYTSLIFSHYYLFPCNHCKNIPTAFPSIVRKLSQKVNHWKCHYQSSLQFSLYPKQYYSYIVPPHTLPIVVADLQTLLLGSLFSYPQSWWVPEDNSCSGHPPCPVDALVPTQQYHLPAFVNANWNPIWVPLVDWRAGA